MMKTGVWLDLKKAIIIQVRDENPDVQVISSGIETKERISGEKKKFGRFANQFLSSEKRKQRKILDQEKRYFKKILKKVSETDHLVIFGPSTTKNKLEQEIKGDKSLKFKLEGVKDADSMTDNQVKAWVMDFYSN